MKYRVLKVLNISLAIGFPVLWFVPLLRTALLPEVHLPDWLGGSTLFSAETITVISGIQKLWEADVSLALAVTFFALVAPMLKCLGMALIQFDLLSPVTQPFISKMGKLAMADIFILSLYIVIAKGLGVGKVEVAWGLYLFTACVIISLIVSMIEGKGPVNDQ